MPPVEKKNLIQDAMDYLNPQTMLWYVQRGLPYRRGYLFYGPPGTGKTSLSLALAGELNLPLYILSLSTSSLSDETLTMLFVELPRKCIVLLEDIDCAGVYREGPRQSYNSDSDDSDSDSDYASEDESKNSSTKAKSKEKGKDKEKDKGGDKDSQPTRRRRPSSSVSFSGLLNAIDGVASHEGRILIMTTNHRERLDPALIRPGRVDLQVEFGYADRPALAEIFRELYKEIGPVKNGAAAPSSSEKESERAHVPRLAEAFAQRIPEGRFTPAEIQGYLQGYKGQPEKALEGIEAWVFSKTKVEREKKARKEAKKARLEERKLLEAAAPTKREGGPADRVELVEKLAGTFARDGEVDSKAFEDFVECIRAAAVHYEKKKVNGAHAGKANGHTNGHVNGNSRGRRVNKTPQHTPGMDSTDDEL
jgi:chaperone BCS1